MALLSSRDTKGRTCPVCGSPDRACGAHASNEPVPIDAPASAPGQPAGPATIQARARINNVDTIILTTPEEAARRGWTPLTATPHPEVANAARGPVSARNEARTTVTVNVEGLDGMTLDQLRAAGAALGLDGAAKLNGATLRKRIRERLAAGGVGA